MLGPPGARPPPTRPSPPSASHAAWATPPLAPEPLAAAPLPGLRPGAAPVALLLVRRRHHVDRQAALARARGLLDVEADAGSILESEEFRVAPELRILDVIRVEEQVPRVGAALFVHPHEAIALRVF